MAAAARAQVVVEKHRHEGVFIARGKEDALVTKNMVAGESVYGEKRIAAEARIHPPPMPTPLLRLTRAHPAPRRRRRG